MEQDIQKIKAVKDKYRKWLMSRTTVHAIGIGRKLVDGKDTGRLCINVEVENKLPKEQLKEEDLIPPFLDGIEVDIRQSGRASVNSEVGRFRPVVGGTSAISYRMGGFCTLGAIVYKNGDAYALSNTHCFYPQWYGGQIGDYIVQPSIGDGGDIPEDVIGTLTEGVTLDFDGGVNTYDAAIAKLSVESTGLYQEGFGTVKAQMKTVQVGDIVQKHGRTSGTTTGTVDSIDFDCYVSYEGGGIAYFEGQIKVDSLTGGNFSQPGDSGSLVLDKDFYPVALNFAGNQDSAFGIEMPIQNVADAFDITFAPSFNVSKSLEYMVISPNSLTTSMKYSLLVNEGDKTKTMGYKVVGSKKKPSQPITISPLQSLLQGLYSILSSSLATVLIKLWNIIQSRFK